MSFSASIFGFLAAALALALELIIIAPDAFPSSSALSWSVESVAILILIAIIEEACKYLLLFQYFTRFVSRLTLSISQLLIQGTVFGLGFASLEVFLAYYNAGVPHRGSGLIGIVLLHIVTSLTLILLIRRFTYQNIKRLLIPLLIAIIIHLCYNSLLSFAAI